MGRFLGAHRRLLLQRIDLHQRRAGRHPLARFHVDLRDLPIHLRRDAGGIARLQRGYVVGSVLNGRGLLYLHFYGHGRRSLRPAGRSLAAAAGKSDCSCYRETEIFQQ